MKKQISILALAALMTVGFAFAAGQDDNVMRKQSDGTYVVNTTTLAANVSGFKGATPVEVYIKNDKVVKVVAMKNRETPRYFEQVDSKMLPKFAGKRISKVGTVDGVSGGNILVKSSETKCRSCCKVL